MFEDEGELIFEDEVPAGHDDGDGQELDVFCPVVGGEDAFPQPESVEEGEILGVDEGDPAEAVEEGVDLEFLHALPDSGFDDLHGGMGTASI